MAIDWEEGVTSKLSRAAKYCDLTIGCMTGHVVISDIRQLSVV